jgi:hypothetical protein
MGTASANGIRDLVEARRGGALLEEGSADLGGEDVACG